MFHEIIYKLENVSSRLEKEAILKEALENDTSGFFLKGLDLALTATDTFGVKQVPIKEEETELFDANLTSEHFFFQVHKLITRVSTGHEARDLITHLMGHYSMEAWNGWYRRILGKDLRCGVDIKTVNKVLKSLKRRELPVFECQLAHDSAKHESKMVGKKLLSVKLDGIRLLSIVYPDGRVEQFSRNGKEMSNFDTIREQLSEHVAPLLSEPFVLDGEVMSSSFQDLMKQARRKENVSTDDAVLHLFDIVPLKDFTNGYHKPSQLERDITLMSVLMKAALLAPNIERLSHIEVDLDTSEGQEVFKQYNKEAVDNGYEGLMLKDPNASYECKRTASWLKLKPFIEVSLTITSFEEGTGKNEGRLGAVVCEGVEEGKTIVVNVGGGFSEAQREEFWANKETLIGRVIEVRADALTKNQDEKNENYSLRFPRFLRFRGFEVGEKL